jgi:DNA-binding transcriptional MerR regulator
MLNLPESDPIELAELAQRAGVSTRTVRYYIQQGLLPAPEARGPGAHYGAEHVDRLLLIRLLQREHLPLAEIRKRIERLSPVEVKRLLVAKPSRPPESATDYVRRVLSEGSATFGVAEPRPMAAMRSVPSPPQAMGMPARSQWDRHSLSPDVELHVRRPVSREENRRIERLMEAARKIFNEEQP